MEIVPSGLATETGEALADAAGAGLGTAPGPGWPDTTGLGAVAAGDAGRLGTRM